MNPKFHPNKEIWSLNSVRSVVIKMPILNCCVVKQFEKRFETIGSRVLSNEPIKVLLDM